MAATSFGPPIGVCQLLTLVALSTVWLACTCPSSSSALPLGIESGNYDGGQLSSLVREYLKIMDKMRAQPKVISGQVNLRAPRSDFMGDMAHALKLYQLQELDRTFGSRSRPRFGKRSEVMVANDLPSYGEAAAAYYEQVQPDDQAAYLQQRR